MRLVKTVLSALFLSVFFSSLTYAATADRIPGAIETGQVVTLQNHVLPLAQPQFDQGAVESSFPLSLQMLITPTPAQQQALQKLIADQQNPGSKSFQQWLTPETYAERFGLSPNDIDKITAWLESQGFKVDYVARGRDYINFSGDAAHVQATLRTEIHRYQVNGKMHFANATSPMIPAALNGIVGGFRGLHNLLAQPQIRRHPDYTVAGATTHFLAPGDLAIIYDINPLYQAAPAIDGTGQKIAIIGQTDVYLADLNNFRSGFSLSPINGCTTNSSNIITACSAPNFQYVPVGTDPGATYPCGDVGESDLDLEWSSSVARGAQVLFVTAPVVYDSNCNQVSGGGVDAATSHAIDNQLAPVMSLSYGICEAFGGSPSISTQDFEFQKAAALGISFFAASGDSGAATCDGELGNLSAVLGPSVNYPASSAYVTGVGGTEFNEGTGTYWSTTNGTNGASVLPNGPMNGYIPEIAWNDTTLSLQSTTNPQFSATGGGQSNCVNISGTTTVLGFGFSICDPPPNGGFAKPSYQSGVTPADGVRDVPDISFSASNANDLYIICTPLSEVGGTGSTSTCATSITDAVNQNSVFGGTSASTPVAAGIAVLLNQYLGTNGLGNINPQLYKLYVSNPAAFHDITTGTNNFDGGTSNNVVPCTSGQPSFEPSALRCSGSTLGFSVLGGHKYSSVTGLGSVDVNALFTAWKPSRSGSSVTISPSAANIQAGSSVTFTATVTPTTGTGTVSFSTTNNGVTTILGTASLNAPYPPTTTGTAALTTSSLQGGSNSVTATFEGNGSDNAASSAPTVVTVSDFTLSSTPTSISVAAGHTSVGITVTITPKNGYAQPTTLTCPGLPSGSSCSFVQNPLPVNGTTPATTTMTILTNASLVGTGGSPLNAPFNLTATNGGSLTHTSPFTLTITATDQSFSLQPQSNSYQVTQGGTINNAIVNLTGTNGFTTANSPVTYTCSDPASESTCMVNSTTATSVTFNITTQPKTGQLRSPFDRGMRIFYASLLPGLLGIMFTAGSRRRPLRGLRLPSLIVALGFSTLWMGACGGNNSSNSNPGTPKGTYTIQVNAMTNGTTPLTAQTTFQLTVQ